MNDFDVITLGEALVDLVPRSRSVPWLFEARPGGAPANVAVGLARLGHRVAHVGRVGADFLGSYVLGAVTDAGVSTQWLQVDPVRPTTVAIVSPRPADESERFVMYRTGGAETALTPDDLPVAAIRKARVLHVGTLSMTTEPSRGATEAAVLVARSCGGVVSVDVNLRPRAWPSLEDMRDAATQLVSSASIIKLSAEELVMLELDPASLVGMYGCLVLVTDGGREATAYGYFGAVSETPPEVEVVDPTGAGDAFVAGFLHSYLNEPTASRAVPAARLPVDVIRKALHVAVKAGSLALGRRGAVEGLPYPEELSAPTVDASVRDLGGWRP